MTQAVILVGGQGTRLRPLTCNLPKPMVPVLNLPFLEHVIHNLKAHKITDIIMAQHYLAESIENYFGNGNDFGVKLTYVMEDNPRGTAGAIKNVEKYIKGTFFVLNGDIFANRNFTDMLKMHRRNHASATIALTPVDDPTIYGVVEIDANKRVTRFLEKPKKEEITTNLINAGTYVLEPEVLKRIAPGIKVSIERETYPQMLSDREPVYAYAAYDYWMDTGTTEKYLQLHHDLLAGKCEGYKFDDGLIAGETSRIDKDVKINGKVIVGINCIIEAGVELIGPLVIGDNCSIRRGTIIADSVIWRNATLGHDVEIQRSAIANDCNIGENNHLTDVVIGDHIKIIPSANLPAGSRLYPEGYHE